MEPHKIGVHFGLAPLGVYPYDLKMSNAPAFNTLSHFLIESVKRENIFLANIIVQTFRDEDEITKCYIS